MDDHAVKQAITTLSKSGRLRPDPDDLRRRARGRALRKRIGAIIAGLVVALASVTALALLLPLSSDRGGVGQASSQGAAPGTCTPSGAEPPEGKFLLRLGSSGGLYGGGQEIDLGPVSVLAFSNSGCDVLAFADPLAGRPGAGKLVSMHLTNEASLASTSVIVQAPAGKALQTPVELSPNGEEIAYTLADASAPEETILCVVEVISRAQRCYPAVKDPLFAGWSPDGASLVLGLPPGQPLETFDTRTGNASMVVSGSDAKVLAAARAAGFLGAQSVQFAYASWSPSGKYLAAMAFVIAGQDFVGAFPAVFGLDGGLIAEGHPSDDLRELAWAPDRDILAYATGSLTPPNPNGTPWAAYLLDPSTGADTLLLSTQDVANRPGLSDPFIIDLAWSPSGRWIALSGRDEVRIVDSTGTSAMQTEQPFLVGTDGELAGWGP